ncbi:SusC/RagA family TonB-linked outer membrane protein [Bacteroidia bacterium]|nr:SusC/RagA family TonB-linked outer membrane protein [Bacteroidia bacterium]
MKKTIPPGENRFFLRRVPFLIVLLLFSANVFSQISVDVKNKPVKEILKEIERSSSFSFFYSEDLKDLDKTASIQVSNASLDETLSLLLKGTNIAFKKQNDDIVLLIPKETAQAGSTKTVSGVVKDANGETLIGASVILKGTSTGVATGMDGNFELTVPDDGTLVVSYMGYNTVEVPVGGKSDFQISLKEDNQMLDEVVVVGYGTVRRRDLTGSVSQINADKIERVAATNVMQAIQGRLPGLSVTQTSGRPGASSDILIHGVQSINGTNAPIFVIDGSIAENADNINPQDIETFTVLKDASAVAIYGSRAANGVIVINTKRGNNGKAPTITFKTEQSVQNEGNLKLGFLNAKQWLELATEAYENGGSNVPWTDADLAQVAGVDVCWPDAMKRTGFLTNNNISVAGGNQKSNYFISLNYLYNKGIIKDQDYQRINLRLNSDHIIRDRIKFGHSVNIYSAGQTTQRDADGRDTYHAAFRETPLNRMYDDNGNVAPYVGQAFQSRTNSPTWMLENSEVKDRSKGVDGNLYLSVDILDGLKATARGSVGWNNYYTTNFLGAMDSKLGMEGGNQNQVTKTNNETLHWIGDFLLDYNKTFGNHSVNALLGYSLEEQTYENLQGVRKGTPSNDIRYLAAGDPSTATNNNEYEEWAFLSVFGRVGYSYKDKYILSGTLRRDGTSRLVGQKYGVFPSVSAAWRIREEAFMQQVGWLNELKLRGSWGIVGNVLAIDPYGTATNLTQRNAIWNQKVSMGYSAANAVNTNLKWESTTKKNIGLDVTVLKNSLYLVSDFYVEDTYDLLFRQPIPYSVGVTDNPYDNIGHIRNTGIDLELGYRKKIGDWSYDVSVNLSHVNNKVIDLKGLSLITDNGGTGNGDGNAYGITTITQEGYPVGSYFGYQTNGLFRQPTDLDNPKFNGADIGDVWYVDVNGTDADGKLTGQPDGKIDAADRVVFGKMRPDFSYGISGQVGYKEFTLQVQLQGIQGIDRYMRVGQAWATDMFGGEANMEADYILDRYHADKNPNGKYPILKRGGQGNNAAFSDFWLVDGSYLSIRNVNLNYRCPDNISGKIGISDLNVYVSVQNLYTFGNPYAEIGNIVNVPIPRTWTFGLRFSL